MLPHDLPPWQTVYDYFSQWRDDGTWERINRELRIEVRELDGRSGEPSAAILDSQSVKTTEMGGERGFDAGKKVKGLKRHLLVDTQGLVLAVMVMTAAIQDRDGAKLLLSKIKDLLPRLRLIWADGGYTGALIKWANAVDSLSIVVFDNFFRSASQYESRLLIATWLRDDGVCFQHHCGWLKSERDPR